jgi:hypothetical protein
MRTSEQPANDAVIPAIAGINNAMSLQSSFPRKRESNLILICWPAKEKWIPASAGMTALWVIPWPL